MSCQRWALIGNILTGKMRCRICQRANDPWKIPVRRDGNQFYALVPAVAFSLGHSTWRVKSDEKQELRRKKECRKSTDRLPGIARGLGAVYDLWILKILSIVHRTPSKAEWIFVNERNWIFLFLCRKIIEEIHEIGYRKKLWWKLKRKVLCGRCQCRAETLNCDSI